MSSGYEANFSPPLEDKYKCPVCLSALRDPIQTKCGHRLCFKCYKTIRGVNWYFRCPVDNQWSNTVFEDNAAKREVLSLTVECFNKVNKCEWTGELRELEAHMTKCSYEQMPCPNECGNKIVEADLETHLSTCPKRLVQCQHCHEDILQTNLVLHHLLHCPRLPIRCSSCGQAPISREKYHTHTNVITGDCPRSIVPCSFQHIGCMYQDQRCNMSKHHQEASAHHMMLLYTRLFDSETKHRLELESLEEKLRKEFTSQQENLEIRMSRLENELGSYQRQYGPLKGVESEAACLENNNSR